MSCCVPGAIVNMEPLLSKPDCFRSIANLSSTAESSKRCDMLSLYRFQFETVFTCMLSFQDDGDRKFDAFFLIIFSVSIDLLCQQSVFLALSWIDQYMRCQRSRLPLGSRWAARFHAPIPQVVESNNGARRLHMPFYPQGRHETIWIQWRLSGKR